MSIQAVIITHLHGDHFGGLAFLDRYLHCAHSRREPLLVVGPEALEEAFKGLLEALFPMTSHERSYPLEIRSYGQASTPVGPVQVRAIPVEHDPASHPHAVRISIGNKILAYSGDTGWTDALVEVAEGADLFICESTGYDRPQKYHLDLKTLRTRRDQLRPKRMLLTHMGKEVLQRLPLPDFEHAEDGLVLTF